MAIKTTVFLSLPESSFPKKKLAEEVLWGLSQLGYVLGFFEAGITELMCLLANMPNDCRLPDSEK